MFNKVIIIDDRIGNKDILAHVENIYIVDDHQMKESEIKENGRLSHSDICAKIILEYIPNVSIINFVVKGTWINGTIEDFLIALEYCRHIDADVVNISVGTTDNNMIDQMSEKIANITMSKLVVAAKSNNLKRTYPSSFENVIECYYYKQKMIANCLKFSLENIKDVRVKNDDGELCLLPLCNSYLTAHVSGLILQKLASGEFV